jgi:hypothetical protein
MSVGVLGRMFWEVGAGLRVILFLGTSRQRTAM